MTIRELVNFANQNPGIMDMELSIAIGPHQQGGGILDGATAILFNPIRTAMFGGDGILLWANPDVTKTQTYNPTSAAHLPRVVFFGPVPDCLR